MHAARREHHVVVELLRQPLPYLERVVVERRRSPEQIVGAHDGGVAPGIAAAEPALFDDRDVGETVLLGQVIGGREAMAARADDHRVVGRFGIGRTPLFRPPLVPVERLTGEAGE